MSDRMWRVSPKRYSPGHHTCLVERYWRMTMSANSRVVTALPLKTRPCGAAVFQREQAGRRYVTPRNPAPPVTRIFIFVHGGGARHLAYTSRVDAAIAPHVNWPARRSPPLRNRSLPALPRR